MAKQLGNYVQDLRVPVGFQGEPRFIRLRRLYGGDGIYAVFLLWSWTAVNFPTSGRLEGMDEDDILDVCCVSRENKNFINDLMHNNAFLERDGEGTYCLPNWRDEQPYVARAEERREAARRSAKSRWDKASGKSGDDGGDPDAMRPHSERKASAKRKGCSNTNTKSLKSPPAPPKGEGCPVKEIVGLYVRLLPELPKPPQITVKMEREIKARWQAQAERRSLAWWEGFFKSVRDYPFLMGESKDWRASLGWLVGRTNMDKVLGGEYQCRGERGPQPGVPARATKTMSLEEFEQMQREGQVADAS